MTAAPPVERLTSADAAAGMRLSSEAGWNQTAADWSYMLSAGQGFGVRAAGSLVATSLAIPYPPEFGWVSMVLVTESHRRRGLATLLLQAAVAHLLGLGLVPMLDATSEGRAVYARLGFLDVEDIDRWQGLAGGASAPPASTLDRYRALDLAAFGADRSGLLDDLASRPGAGVWGDEFGYALCRQGRLATQLGPVVASTAEGGSHFIGRVLDGLAGAVMVDVPRSASAAGSELGERGFSVRRRFHRMALGRSTGFGDRKLVQVIGGPELG